jgi:hypothetical protein
MSNLILPDRWNQPVMRPHPMQSAYLRSLARYRMLPCGRQSGKSELCKREVVLNVPKVNPLGKTNILLCLAPTYTQAKQLWWQDLKDLIPPSWIRKVRDSDLVIECEAFGVRTDIKVAGFDVPKRLEGPAYSQVWVDEFADVKPDAFDTALRPAMTTYKARVTFLGVPKRYGSNGSRYRKLCEWGFDPAFPNYETFTWPSWDIRDPEEIEEIKRTTDDATFQEQYGAAWLTAGGTCFFNFEPETHVQSVKYDPNKPILVGADFNVDPMARVLAQTDGKHLWVFGELFLNNTNTKATQDVLYAKYGRHKGGWHFFGDPAGRARHTSASASDWTQIMNDQRFRPVQFNVPEAAPPVRDRLASCNALLRNAAGQSRCTIDPSCTFLIEDLKNRGIDSNGLPNDPKGGTIGHLTDAWGYMIHALWPSTLVAVNHAPQFHEDVKAW